MLQIASYILEKFLGKASESAGGKALGGLSGLAAKNFRRFVNRRRLDFLSSDDDFHMVRVQLELIQHVYRDIFRKLDEMYLQEFAHGDTGIFLSEPLLLISARLAEIQRQTTTDYGYHRAAFS